VFPCMEGYVRISKPRGGGIGYVIGYTDIYGVLFSPMGSRYSYREMGKKEEMISLSTTTI
jgi:hypothetical protein